MKRVDEQAAPDIELKFKKNDNGLKKLDLRILTLDGGVQENHNT